MPEDVPDDEDASRHLFAPSMGAPGGDLIWSNVFQFPSEANYCESLVWRRYAPTMAEVHTLGCNTQAFKRGQGRNQTYIGALTSNIGRLRCLRSLNGARFIIEQVPDEGQWHLHISFDQTQSLTRNDKAELKKKIKDEFAARSEHACEEAA